MIQATFRPIDQWLGVLRPSGQRIGHTFKASYTDTLDLLQRELEHLKAKDIVIQLDLDEGQIRNDGWPRSGSRPGHPGVIVSFDSIHGPLRYFTDVFTSNWNHQMEPWQANLRAIALGLEALRKVDRYGITKRGEQYTGWKSIGSGIAMPAAGPMTVEEAAEFLGRHSGYVAGGILEDLRREKGTGHGRVAKAAYRQAAKKLHPDAGGDPELFKELSRAADVLGL
jgi:hypothetical protein